MRRISTTLRQSVWTFYAGNSNFTKCYVCCDLVSRYNKGWHCSHVIAYSKGGKNNIENLRVCCLKCNLKMKTKNLYFDINQTFDDRRS